MNKLFLPGTEDTPEIIFDYADKKFVVLGRSLPEDVTSFFAPVLEWLDAFAAKPLTGADFQFKLEYFNTASSKVILDVLMKLEEISSASGDSIKVSWYYQENDDDMLEAGEEYKELVALQFDLIPY